MQPAVASETDLGDPVHDTAVRGDPVHNTAVRNTGTGYPDALAYDYGTETDAQSEPARSPRFDGHPRSSQTTVGAPDFMTPTNKTPAVQIAIDQLRDRVDRLAGDLCKAEASLVVAMQMERKLNALEQEKNWWEPPKRRGGTATKY